MMPYWWRVWLKQKAFEQQQREGSGRWIWLSDLIEPERSQVLKDMLMFMAEFGNDVKLDLYEKK